jgi:hypothetical protein
MVIFDEKNQNCKISRYCTFNTDPLTEDSITEVLTKIRLIADPL